MSVFTDVPGTVRYFRVGRVPVKLTYGPAEVQFQGRGWVKVDAHNLVCPEMRHALTYVEECDDEITEARYLEMVQAMDDADLSFERKQLTAMQTLLKETK